MNTKELIATVVAILAALAVVVFIITTMVNVGTANREKVVQMHTTCVESGFSGWDEYYGCIGGSGNGS